MASGEGCPSEHQRQRPGTPARELQEQTCILNLRGSICTGSEKGAGQSRFTKELPPMCFDVHFEAYSRRDLRLASSAVEKAAAAEQ
jgi:hypothetical protein